MRFVLSLMLSSLVASCSSSAPSNPTTPKSPESKPIAPGDDAPKVPAGPTIIRGSVVDAGTHEPIRGVTVVLRAANPDPDDPGATDCKDPDDLSCSSITDETGRFERELDVAGKRTVAFYYSDIQVVWTGEVCQGVETTVPIEIDTTQPGGEVIEVTGPPANCPAVARVGDTSLGACSDAPEIDPTGVPGRDRLSSSPHRRPTLEEVSNGLPELVERYALATVAVVQSETLAPYAGTVSSCSRMADMVTYLFTEGHLSVETAGEMVVPGMGVILAGVMEYLTPVAIRYNKDDDTAVDVFLSLPDDATPIADDEVAKLDRKESMALLITEQDGALVLAGVSKPLLDYVQDEWSRLLR